MLTTMIVIVSLQNPSIDYDKINQQVQNDLKHTTELMNMIPQDYNFQDLVPNEVFQK